MALPILWAQSRAANGAANLMSTEQSGGHGTSERGYKAASLAAFSCLDQKADLTKRL
jgi:hypothetical protein